jgi:hypothetical protein
MFVVGADEHPVHKVEVDSPALYLVRHLREAEVDEDDPPPAAYDVGGGEVPVGYPRTVEHPGFTTYLLEEQPPFFRA